MLSADEVVKRLGGAAQRQDVLRHTSRHALREALAHGAVRRVSRGVYALPEVPPVYPLALALNGLVSHGSAARHWLLEGVLDPAAHVTVPKKARPRAARGVVIHFSDVAAADDRDGVTSPRRTVLDCARTLPFPEALAVADSALRRTLVSTDELVRAAGQLRGPGRRRIQRVVEAADGRAANPFESTLRAVVIEAGLTGFEPQVPIRGHVFARVDLGHPELRIALEADSFAFHGSREALSKDCQRYDELVRMGWLVLRFSWEQVMFEGDWVASVVRDVVALRRNLRSNPRLSAVRAR